MNWRAAEPPPETIFRSSALVGPDQVAPPLGVFDARKDEEGRGAIAHCFLHQARYVRKVLLHPTIGHVQHRAAATVAASSAVTGGGYVDAARFLKAGDDGKRWPALPTGRGRGWPFWATLLR
jgi:hypothetical protein